ncbi:MAG: cation:proton antiporter [Methanomicrobia archaeon]|nr:cation:proton antiporter [Methanomicrobia archaeon]RLF93328.1 MAG: cation:proton antiporter [Thermococci archaeon]
MSSRIVETATNIVIPFMILFGIYIIINGHLTPGGGFQGGVILGSCALLIYMVFGIKKHVKYFSIFENIGALVFLFIGLSGIILGGFLFSNFIAKGTPGTVISGGTIPLINIAIGLKVAAGFAILFFIVLEYIERRN